jgi:hypothetical protein
MVFHGRVTRMRRRLRGWRERRRKQHFDREGSPLILFPSPGTESESDRPNRRPTQKSKRGGPNPPRPLCFSSSAASRRAQRKRCSAACPARLAKAPRACTRRASTTSSRPSSCPCSRSGEAPTCSAAARSAAGRRRLQRRRPRCRRHRQSQAWPAAAAGAARQARRTGVTALFAAGRFEIEGTRGEATPAPRAPTDAHALSRAVAPSLRARTRPTPRAHVRSQL